MGVYLARLPSAYQEVERIRSSGSQYFDTGFYPTGNSEIEIDFVRESGSNVGTFGVDSGWTRNAFSILNDRIFCYGSQYQSPDQNYYAIGTRYLMKFKNLTCTLNGVTKFTYSSNSFTSSYSAYMFAKRRNNYIEAYSSITCYSLKLWNNGTLARDYVPCYRKSDGVIGMYDLVNNTFNTNQGSGRFTKGPDVMSELKNAYIGEVWKPGANTIAYYPLTSISTSSDMSGNGHTLTTFTGITFNTLASGKSIAQFSGSSSGNSCYAYTDEFTVGNIGTLSIWAKPENNGGNYANKYILLRMGYQNNNQQARINLFTAWIGYYCAEHCGQDTQNYQSSISPIVDGSWHHFVATSTTNNVSLYIDGVLIGSNTNSITERTDTGRIYVASNNDSYYGFKGGVSEAIVEDKVWTAQEVADYYNLTKSNYGL